jgi:hypothetical protein
LAGQRIGFSLDVQRGDGVMDGGVEFFGVGEGLVSEVMGFEVAPDGFDVVEFGRVFGQPLDGEPMRAGGERRCRGLAETWIGPLSSTITTGLPGAPGLGP